ncbi:response regulator [Achromobacter sp. NPDC008082]|uniref:response regulator n=1 Tax=Achromobacter sp. NPDC008082 TaxID=3363888 RepID=UPI0036E78256
MSDHPPASASADPLAFLAGGGQTGALIRAHDWAGSELGSPEGWPLSLKTALRIMLTARQPIWIGWGPDLLFFYNDPYLSIIGGRHPAAMAQPTRLVWHEIWPYMEPLLQTAMADAEGTYEERKLLIMERNGYPEETYYTFSFSPVPGDDGVTSGIICVNSDETRRVIADRQQNLLRELAIAMPQSATWRQACELSAQAFAANAYDIPFAMLYAVDSSAGMAELVGTYGIEPDSPGAPQTLPLDGGVWPCGEALRAGALVLIDDLAGLFGGPLPKTIWDRPADQAVLIPILPSSEGEPACLLISALNPLRLFTDDYREFLTLAAAQIGASIRYARAYEHERARAQALAEVDHAKTAFFSNISHEFRTPLTLMLAPLEDMLTDPDVPPRLQSAMKMANRNGQRLLKLVNTLLDFSRIEAGRVKLDLRATEISAFTADLASLFQSSLEKAGLTLDVDCPPLPRAVMLDRDMWEKVILNLLSNAYKFTYRGGVRIASSVAPDGETAVVEISDTGMGIPESELPRVFDRFHQVEGVHGRSIEGSGIGLALVQEFMQLQGGSVAVASTPGVGTTFTLRLPLGPALDIAAPSTALGSGAARSTSRPYIDIPGPDANVFDDALAAQILPHTPGAETARTAPSASTGQPQTAETDAPGTILVVDDNDDMRAYICRVLRTAHYRIHTAKDGEAALAHARQHRPDLVLSDVMMPRLDGFGLLAALRQDPALRTIPVLLLSARAGEEASVEGLRAGADDYLIKPFSARELLARVSSNLRLSALRQETEKRLAEEARTLELRVNQAIAERDRLWEHSDDLFVIADGQGRMLRLNPSWTRWLGHPEAALAFQRYDTLLHPDDLLQAQAQFQALRGGMRSLRAEHRLRTADDDWRWMAWMWSFDAESNSIHGVGRDITADKVAAQTLRETEEALRMAQKMEALGKLTGGVAHDFNNLLQVIGGNLQLLSRSLAGDERAQQRTRNALAGVERGAKLASQLLAFGRRQPLAPKVVNLGRFMRGFDDMLRRIVGDGIEVETVISGGLWNTLVDPYQVENALLNLAINARDAMEGHGKLTIEAGNALLDDDYAARHAEVHAGQYVMLAVSDTGCGMDKELVQRAFEPFFTTKPEGQGTGLGLSMVYGFVRQTGGHVNIYSEPGMGTTVRLYLPRATQAEDPVIELDTSNAEGGDETVLVVEDDEDVRTTVVDMLVDLGYRVLKAADAQSAMSIIDSGVNVDLLFTDVVMPGPLRSRDVALRARARLPRLAVLFTSGYADNAIVHGGRLDEGIELLSKPYTAATLARKLRQMLRARPPASASAYASTSASASASASASTSASGLSLSAGDALPNAALARRVLLVEDMEAVRLTTEEILSSLGHEVIHAATAAQASERLLQHHIDILLTDVGLPDGSGIDLAVWARTRQPTLAVVFSSGRDVLADARSRAGLSGVHQLLKPYSPQQLESVIAMLAQPASHAGRG